MKFRIQMLGAPSIWTPTGPLAPARPLVFATVLYLCLNRGREVRRTQLSALLWPDATDAVRGERTRWLVHQLRQVGLVITGRSPHITLGTDDVALDVDALVAAASAADALALAHGDVLAGYEPRISDTFSNWIDETRDSVRSRVVGALDGWLHASRRTASWPLVEELARKLLALDALHELATIALAESLALRGRRDASRKVLAQFAEETGNDLGASAAVQLLERLRQPAADEPVRRRSPLAGRKDALATLLGALDSSRQTSRRVALAGPPGIGKTRLLDELITLARLRGTRVVHVRCGSADALRPLSLVSDLARALLEVRGALGASPSSIETLRVFLGEHAAETDDRPNEARRAAVYAALRDLLGALSEEGSLLLVIDDAQWAEAGSWAVLGPLFSQPATAVLSWVIAARVETRNASARMFTSIFPSEGVASDQFRDTIWLAPLDRAEVVELAETHAAPRALPPDVLELLVRRAAGNPFIAEALADHWLQGGDVSTLPQSVERLVSARLDRLSPDVTSVLETVAVLGPYAELGGLESVCLIERVRVLDALRELETAGIIRTADGVLSAHALWTEAVLSRAPRTTIQVLHRYSAQWLEDQTATLGSTDHGRHWAVAKHWLEAGDSARALRALSIAADVLSASGFLAQAAEMLEHCAEIVEVSEATFRYWTRAASLWLNDNTDEGNAAVTRLHEQYDRVGKAFDPWFSTHHELEVMAHTVFCRLYATRKPLDEERRWLQCVTEARARPLHRILAATRIIDRCSQRGIDRALADDAWRALETVVPETPRERTEANLCAALYFSRVEDQQATAVAHAERARAAISTDDEPDDVHVRRVLQILSDCHESAGDLDRAQAVRWDMFHRAEQRRNSTMRAYALGLLIVSSLEAGRIGQARQLLPALGRPRAEMKTDLEVGQMISWVVCALEEGNAVAGRAEMRIPLSDAETGQGAMPEARILAIYAHLALLEGDDATAERLLPLLLACFSGRMSFMHHPAYVAGLCLQRFRGPAAAAEFVQHFIDDVSSERWTPRIELLRMARGEDPHLPPSAADADGSSYGPP